jgi:phosphoglucosamine mutase
VHPQLHFCPDGPISAALLLKALEEENKTLSEFIHKVPSYITRRQNIVCKNELKHKMVENVADALEFSFPHYTDFSRVDGVRIALKGGWLLIRASGTEPLIRLTVEGESLAVANDITQNATALIRKQVEAETR